MAMTAGSVTIDDSGNHSGSGCAYDAYVAFAPSSPDYAVWKATDNARTLKQIALLIEAVCQTIIGHVKTNGEAVIGTGDTGLQTTTNVGVATDGPSAEKRIGLD